MLIGFLVAAIVWAHSLAPMAVATLPSPAEPVAVASGPVPWLEPARLDTWRDNGCAAPAAASGQGLPAPLLTVAAMLGLTLLAGVVVLRRRRHGRVARAGYELREARARLRAADERTAAFLAVLAHELRNPLAPIRSAVEVMRQLDIGSEPRLARARAILARQVQHLGRLIDDLLDAARVSHNLIALRPTTVAVADIVSDALEQAADAVARGAHELVVHHADPTLTVRGDRLRLAQVIAALVDNAARFTPGGGHLTVVSERVDGAAQISVHDDGIGIPADAQARIFELFAQEGVTLAHATGGLGVGLALARQLVTLHGGTIEVDSVAGGGSTFRVRLPLTERATADRA